MARTILIGDIHGCAEEFGRLVERVGYAQGVDRLVLVGDLVARGPDSGLTVKRAMEYGAEAVRGNHDEKVLSWWRIARTRGKSAASQRVKLGERHRLAVQQLSNEQMAFLDGLPLMLDLREHGALVVHAGVVPNVPIERQDPHLLMNVRSLDSDGEPTRKLTGTPWAQAWGGPAHVVFGHDARRGLQVARCATGLDTGCCYGRELTALVLAQGEAVPKDERTRRAHLVSEPAREAYCPIGDGSGPE